MMYRVLALAVIASLLLLSGCADSAKDKFDTAQFEELQNNREHARQLYEDIVRSHPGSDYAKKAKERLDAMSKTPPQSQ